MYVSTAGMLDGLRVELGTPGDENVVHDLTVRQVVDRLIEAGSDDHAGVIYCETRIAAQHHVDSPLQRAKLTRYRCPRFTTHDYGIHSSRVGAGGDVLESLHVGGKLPRNCVVDAYAAIKIHGDDDIKQRHFEMDTNNVK